MNGSEHSSGRPVFIVDGARTPFIKAQNKPGPFTPVDLAVQAGRPLLERQPFDRRHFDEVIVGCVNVHPDEVNPGRVAGLRLGLGIEIPGWTVQRNCASGLQSIDCGFRAIGQGLADLVLAGGTEALSHAPLLFTSDAAGWFGSMASARTTWQKLERMAAFRPGHLKPSIGLVRGLTDPVVKLNMGQTAEVLAHRFNVSREEMDAYALESHRRLARAQAEGHIEELVPMIDRKGKLFDHDDGVRPESSMADLARLKPVFEPPFGKVTAGNSSQITDGASWVILASEPAIARFKLNPMARIVDCNWAALDPSVMGLGPVLSMVPMIRRNGLSRSDIGAFELNEAFAAQVLACQRALDDRQFCRDILGLDEPVGSIAMDILNIDGGAISLGHPVGASGNRITLHLIHVMRRLKARHGVATACIGGGMGGAALLELM
jgi:acetyl-CoA C-acetyltransferase